MKSVEASGKTRKEAVQAALDKMRAELHEVKVEVLDEGSRGFFGLGARNVRVRVSMEGAEDEEVDFDSRGNDAAALLQEIIRRMGIRADVSTDHLEDGSIRLSIESGDSAILIGRKGKTLAALQYLINRMVNTGEDPDKVERIIVDTEGYLNRRRDSLEELAQRLAQRAKETNRRVRLKPLDPQERRIIHLTLQDDPDVETYSVGNAQIRSVVIQPKGMVQLTELPDDVEDDEDQPPRGERRGGRHHGRGRGDRHEGPRPEGAQRRGGEGGGRREGGPRGERPNGPREDGGRRAGGGPRREGAPREGAPRGEGGRREVGPRGEGGRREGGPRGEGGRREGGPRGERFGGPRPERSGAPQEGAPREPQGDRPEGAGAGRRRRRRRGGGGGNRPEGGAPNGGPTMTPRSSALMGEPRAPREPVNTTRVPEPAPAPAEPSGE